MDIWNTIVNGLHGIGVHLDKDTAQTVGQAADQVGQVDYWLKSEASLARDVLATVQEVREAVREGRHKASS